MISSNFLRPFIFLSAGLIFFMASCRQIEVFEKNTSIPDYNWAANFPATGTFEIKDTLASYNIYIVLRHTDQYGFNNIWMNVGLQSPGDSLFFQQVDMPLGNDAAGWEGTGSNDIWEVRKALVLNRRFKKQGEYHFKIFNIMRLDPLPHIMSVGMRVEKAQ